MMQRLSLMAGVYFDGTRDPGRAGNLFTLSIVTLGAWPKSGHFLQLDAEKTGEEV